MTTAKYDHTSKLAPLVPDVDSLDDRSRRAWTEPMAIRALRDGRYAVDSESGATYVVDLFHRDCSCPDHEIRGALCKHIRRVAIEISQGRIPAPDRTIRCQSCGRKTSGAVDTEPPYLCEKCTLEPGDLVFDRERGHDTPLLVVSVTDRRADEVEIPALGGTVADYGVNRKYDASDPVVEVIYPQSIRADEPPRKYSFPLSRLEKSQRDDRQTTLTTLSVET